jgi:hypothetical protein
MAFSILQGQNVAVLQKMQNFKLSKDLIHKYFLHKIFAARNRNRRGGDAIFIAHVITLKTVFLCDLSLRCGGSQSHF